MDTLWPLRGAIVASVGVFTTYKILINMDLKEISSKINDLIWDNWSESDPNKVWVTSKTGKGCSEVKFCSPLPFNEPDIFVRYIIFKENDDDAAQKIQMIERFLKKEITFNQLFNDK